MIIKCEYGVEHNACDSCQSAFPPHDPRAEYRDRGYIMTMFDTENPDMIILCETCRKDVSVVIRNWITNEDFPAGGN